VTFNAPVSSAEIKLAEIAIVNIAKDLKYFENIDYPYLNKNY
jgi:hypothetical protein